MHDSDFCPSVSTMVRGIFHGLLTKIEKDLMQICELKSVKSQNSASCGAFVYDLKVKINGFLMKDLKAHQREEKVILKDCLIETRKMLRLVQNSFGTKVSMLTIHSIILDILNYIRDPYQVGKRVI
jgi:hypothetical protein